MKNLVKIQYKQLVFTAMATVVFMFAANSFVDAQDRNQTYTVGELIEVKWADTWLKANIVEEKNGWYTIIYEVDGTKNFVQKDRMRPLPGAKKTPPKQTEEQTDNPTKTETEIPKDKEIGVKKYKPGDRVECDKAGINSWEKGTVMPHQKNDFKDGKTFRVRLDSFARAGMYLDGHDCRVENMRLLAGEKPYENESTTVPVGKATVDAENTLSADRPILECPTKQTPVKNGARPNAELFKKIIRCRKGEKPAAKGYDGAVTVDVTVLQPGATRPWIYGRDIGGKPGTIIHPVKTTFHYKTFYRSSTEVSQNWIRIINFYVNAFGEWETGSEESVKMGETVNIPRDQ